MPAAPSCSGRLPDTAAGCSVPAGWSRQLSMNHGAKDSFSPGGIGTIHSLPAVCCLFVFFFFYYSWLWGTSRFLPAVGVQPAHDSSSMDPCVWASTWTAGTGASPKPRHRTLPVNPRNPRSDPSTSPITLLPGHPFTPVMCLDTHTGFRVSPTADFRPLEILSGRRNVSISLATRLEAGQRETKLSYTPPKNLPEFLRVTGKAGFGLLTPLAPEQGGEMMLLGWPGIFTLLSVPGNYLNQALLKLFSLEIILTGHQISDFSTYPKSVLNVMVTWYQAVFSESFPRTFHQHHSSLSFQWHLAKFQINTQFFLSTACQPTSALLIKLFSLGLDDSFP